MSTVEVHLAFVASWFLSTTKLGIDIQAKSNKWRGVKNG